MVEKDIEYTIFFSLILVQHHSGDIKKKFNLILVACYLKNFNTKMSNFKVLNLNK